eukprot:TRINITY_DN35377_c0_g1_i1.p1 TRINITY_DN35377_c0_g1~~TRINITY_DN35377_c0_g1_i1.p1  ORF type:complete len:359 (+),score=79.11 TRINITY_DN35377_c0_g1_i1:52-1077(+)
MKDRDHSKTDESMWFVAKRIPVFSKVTGRGDKRGLDLALWGARNDGPEKHAYDIREECVKMRSPSPVRVGGARNIYGEVVKKTVPRCPEGHVLVLDPQTSCISKFRASTKSTFPTVGRDGPAPTFTNPRENFTYKNHIYTDRPGKVASLNFVRTTSRQSNKMTWVQQSGGYEVQTELKTRRNTRTSSLPDLKNKPHPSYKSVSPKVQKAGAQKKKHYKKGACIQPYREDVPPCYLMRMCPSSLAHNITYNVNHTLTQKGSRSFTNTFKTRRRSILEPTHVSVLPDPFPEMHPQTHVTSPSFALSTARCTDTRHSAGLPPKAAIDKAVHEISTMMGIPTHAM